MNNEDLMDTEKIIYDMTTILGGQVVLNGRISAKLRHLKKALDKACKALETNSTRDDVDSCWECPRKNDCFNCSAERWKEWCLGE